MSSKSKRFLELINKFLNGKRKVTLIGEAFFEVTRNPTMPFIVHTDNLKTTVLGTSFNVKTFKDVDTQVMVATNKLALLHLFLIFLKL